MEVKLSCKITSVFSKAAVRNIHWIYFAMLESILLIAGLAQRYRFELIDAAPIEFFPSVTLRPKKGLRVRVKAR